MRIVTLIVLFLFLSCKEEPKLTANKIVDMAIEKACQKNCDNAQIAFVFRGTKFISKRSNGNFHFERIMKDSLGIIRDVLTNQRFERSINDSLIAIPDSTAIKYANSVNSVHYFAQLPYGLNAPAANLELLGEDEINNATYYEIGVSFSEEGGGTDHEDKFVYWIHKDNFTVDFIAYSYAVDGGGIRFREAYNERKISGIRFVDYNNYKPKDLDVQLTDLDALFEEDKLDLVSKIIIEEVEVEIDSALVQ